MVPDIARINAQKQGRMDLIKLVQERKLREWLEGTFFSACVLFVVPHIVGIAGKSWVQNYRGPGDWCRMTRVPDIGSKAYP